MPLAAADAADFDFDFLLHYTHTLPRLRYATIYERACRVVY